MTTERVAKNPKLPMSFMSFRAKRRILNAAEVAKAQAGLKDCFGDSVEMLDYGIGLGSVKPVKDVTVLSRGAADMMIRRIADKPFEQTVLRGVALNRLEYRAGIWRKGPETVSPYRYSTRPVENTIGQFSIAITVASAQPLVEDRHSIFRSLAKTTPMGADVPSEEVRLLIGKTSDEAVAAEINQLLFTSGADLQLAGLEFER